MLRHAPRKMINIEIVDSTNPVASLGFGSRHRRHELSADSEQLQLQLRSTISAQTTQIVHTVGEVSRLRIKA